MKIPVGLVGTTVGPLTQEIDARWIMAYAAGLGETDPVYLDTLRPDGLVPHPLFPVSYEWPVAVESRARQLGDEISLRGVHATHDLTLHRPRAPATASPPPPRWWRWRRAARGRTCSRATRRAMRGASA